MGARDPLELGGASAQTPALPWGLPPAPRRPGTPSRRLGAVNGQVSG